MVSREAAAKGLHLIFEHAVAFVESHMLGTAEATVIFRPESLQSGYTLVLILLSIGHLIYLCLGAIGAALLYRSLAPTLHAVMLITLVAVVFSVLTGGALRSPRFSIPLDVILVVGLTYCVAKLQERVTRAAAFATISAKVS